MPSSHGFGNDHSTQTAREEGTKLFLPSERPDLSDAEQSLADDVPTEKLFKFKEFFSNPERAEKFLEYDDNERKTNDNYLLNEDHLSRFDSQGFAEFCETLPPSTKKATIGQVYDEAQEQVYFRDFRKEQAEYETSQQTTGTRTADDQTQEAAEGASPTAVDDQDN